MKAKKRQIRAFFCLIAIGLLLFVMAGSRKESRDFLNKESESIQAESAAEELEVADAVWITYWDSEKILERVQQADTSSVCLFAVSYDEEGGLLIPENIQNMVAQIQAKKYLTFVNDRVTSQGAVLKDPDLLYELLGSERQAENCAEAMFAAASQIGVEGIEVDYEGIKRDMELWQLFQNFLEILTEKAKEQGFFLRVLLEPGIPIEELSLPEGPEYVVMCYNLHGTNTEPGPKADREFLESLADKFSCIPDIGYALANGGCLWDAFGNGEFITTKEAEALAVLEETAPRRDLQSGAFMYSFEGPEGPCTVWYGNGETLEWWRAQLENKTGGAVKISIWRVGG